MKVALVALFVVSFVELHEGRIAKNWFLQKVDNFNMSDERTWRMNYWTENAFYVKGGPIFIIVGGESANSKTLLISGHFRDLARKYKAYLFYTEHRFYGSNIPDTSITDLKYLSSQQALADLANFIRTIKQNLILDHPKVILHGASYPGSLVVWFQRLYPSLIDGGWASSAPILAVDNVAEFTSRIASAIIAKAGRKCYDLLFNGMSRLEQLYRSNRSDEAKSRLRLCDSFSGSSGLDISSLFYSIMNVVISSTLQNTISDICNMAEQKQEDGLTTIANIVWRNFNWKGCVFASYNDTIRNMVPLTRLRRYYYQMCNEFGWFTASGFELFGDIIHLAFFTKMCQDIFGQKYNKFYIKHRIEETNRIYGGLYPNVKNIYFTQGSLDPWRLLGSPEAIVIPGAMHCDDTQSISSKDSFAMKESKDKIDQLIGEWTKKTLQNTKRIARFPFYN